MHDQRFVLDQRPFHGSFAAVNIDALAILTSRVKQAADDAGVDVGVFKFDVRSFDGERAAVFLNQFLANGAAAEATDVFGRLADESGDRSDAMRRIPHGRKAGPVIWPAI